MSFDVINYNEPISDSEPSLVTKNQSPETSMVVDKVETVHQVTQKVTPMFKKRRNKNASSFSSPQSSKVQQLQIFTCHMDFGLFDIMDLIKKQLRLYIVETSWLMQEKHVYYCIAKNNGQ